MSPDRPDVTIVPTFQASSVVFEVRVTNPSPADMRSVRLTPKPVPRDVVVDRQQHLIPLLASRKTRTVAFKLRPGPGHQVVALDIIVEWEGSMGTTVGRTEVSSRPVELTLPRLHKPRQGLDRWRAGLTGGFAVEARLRQKPSPDELLALLEEALEGAPGTVSVSREMSPRGPTGRIWVRVEGPKGRRAGVLVDVTPDPSSGGSRVLVTVTATTEELLALFYHFCLVMLANPLPGLEQVVPHSLSEVQ